VSLVRRAASKTSSLFIFFKVVEALSDLSQNVIPPQTVRPDGRLPFHTTQPFVLTGFLEDTQHHSFLLIN
jgi:hypothetical protein